MQRDTRVEERYFQRLRICCPRQSKQHASRFPPKRRCVECSNVLETVLPECASFDRSGMQEQRRHGGGCRGKETSARFRFGATWQGDQCQQIDLFSEPKKPTANAEERSVKKHVESICQEAKISRWHVKKSDETNCRENSPQEVLSFSMLRWTETRSSKGSRRCTLMIQGEERVLLAERDRRSAR